MDKDPEQEMIELELWESVKDVEASLAYGCLGNTLQRVIQRESFDRLQGTAAFFALFLLEETKEDGERILEEARKFVALKRTLDKHGSN